VTSDSTRWTVIRRAAEGNPADREEFVRRYAPVIRSYLKARWRMTPMIDDVDDGAQLVFLDCFKENGALGRVDPERGDFRAFLYGVVRNVARNLERKRARRRERQPDSEIDLEAFASKEESLASVFDRAWAAALMRDAATLQLERAKERGPEAVRRHRLLALRYGDGLPLRKIAARWSVAPDLLHREYPKAREEFRRALMDVVREMQGGGREAVEGECARLLAHFSPD
jgi:RNA polymerase sigma factor (sigma-70 family)